MSLFFSIIQLGNLVNPFHTFLCLSPLSPLSVGSSFLHYLVVFLLRRLIERKKKFLVVFYFNKKLR